MKKPAAISVCRSMIYKWAGADLNRRHTDFQSVALPTELPAQIFRIITA